MQYLRPDPPGQKQHNQTHELRLKTDHAAVTIDAIQAALGYRARRITRFVVMPGEAPEFDEVSIRVTRLSADDLKEMTQQLQALPHVHAVTQPTI